MSKQKKNKGGRPKEKVSDKVDFDQVERLAELGHTDSEIGYILGYSKRTIDRWKSDEEFMALLKRGKLKADSKVVESLYKRAIGFEFDEITYEKSKTGGLALKITDGEVSDIKHSDSNKVKIVTKFIVPDTTAQIFWLKNRQPDKWRDKQEIEHSGELKTISETTHFCIKPKGK